MGSGGQESCVHTSVVQMCVSQVAMFCFPVLCFHLSCLRDTPEKMVNAIKGEVKRRGNPLDKTAWGVKAYTRFQLAMHAAGQLRDADLGGFAFRLPSKSPDNEPAELPADVRHFMETGELPPVKRPSKREKDDDGKDAKLPMPKRRTTLPYKITEHKGKQVLVHESSGNKVYLPRIKEADYIVYANDDGDAVVWSQVEGDEPKFCTDIMPEASENEEPEPVKKSKTPSGPSKITAGAAQLKGQPAGQPLNRVITRSVDSQLLASQEVCVCPRRRKSIRVRRQAGILELS